jgi:hypothetical protein
MVAEQHAGGEALQQKNPWVRQKERHVSLDVEAFRENGLPYGIWSALWGTAALPVTLDRCRFTPPWRVGENQPLSLHWDHNPNDTTIRWI